MLAAGRSGWVLAVAAAAEAGTVDIAAESIASCGNIDFGSDFDLDLPS